MVVESPSLEVFKNHEYMVLSNTVSRRGGDGLELSLGVLEVFSNLNDSMMKLLEISSSRLT